MIEPLFVHSQEEVLNQIRSESEAEQSSRPHFASSYLQGLRLVNDASLSISAIYLNPYDTTYSALKFLAIALQKRPATPLFLLDAHRELNPQNVASLKERFQIKGVFQNSFQWKTLIAPLVRQLPEPLSLLFTREQVESRFPGYHAIPLVDFLYCRNYPANVFVVDENQELRFFAMEGSEVDLDYLSYLSQKNSQLYIEKSTMESRLASYRLIEESYLDPAYLSPSWRMAETFFRAKAFLEDLKKNGVSEEMVDDTYSLFQDLFTLSSQMSQNSKLSALIDQAKQCDRTVACATLTMLLCKKLGYERSSILETLGFASLVQDVSLYQSPYGNLNEIDRDRLNGKAEEYFLNHPVISAELIARVRDVPDLTLQIIRQQHERFDRTGFPLRVGGAQLQPLAEVLSLVNSYLDSEKTGEKYLPHYSDRIVKPFQELMQAIGMGTGSL